MTGLLAVWFRHGPALLDGLGTSAAVTAVGLLLGLPLGLLLALGLRSRFAVAHWPSLILVEIGRGVPVLILLGFASAGPRSVGWSPSSFAAAGFALTWYAGAHTSTILRAGLDAVPHGQIEAAAAIGLTDLDALRFVLLPQGLRGALPALLGFAILLLQVSSLCSAIGLPELVGRARDAGATASSSMTVMILAGLLYLAICAPATLLVATLERRIRRRTA